VVLALCGCCGAPAARGAGADDAELVPAGHVVTAPAAGRHASGQRKGRANPAERPVPFEAEWLRPFFAGPILQKASVDFRQERWGAAEVGFTRGIAKLPPTAVEERHAARFLLALASSNQSKWLPAATLFQALFREYPRLAPYHAYNAARCLLRAGRLDEALGWADKVAPDSVVEADAALVSIDAQRGLGLWKSVLAATERYLVRFPNGARRSETLFKQAEALEKLGDDASEMVEVTPPSSRPGDLDDDDKDGGDSAPRARIEDHPSAVDGGPGGALAGREANSTGKWPGAPAKPATNRLGRIIALYRRVWAEAPLDGWADRAAERLQAISAGSAAPAKKGSVTGASHTAGEWVTRGMVYFDRNRNVESEAAFTSALAGEGLDADLECRARYHRAQSVWKQRQRPRAAPLFDAAESVCARAGNRDLRAKALYQGARSWATAGDRAAAERRYAQVEAEHADHSYADDARLRTAELAQDAGEEDKANQLLAEIPRKYPKGDLLGEALWRLAFSAWRAQRWDDALRWLEQNLTSIPHEDIWYAEGRALYWKARILEKKRAPDEAKRFYERAIREYPLSVYAFLSLGRLADCAPRKRAQLIHELRKVHGRSPTSQAFQFAPRALFGEVGFRRAVDLARMGQGGDARRELARLGLQTAGEKHAGPSAKGDGEDLLWIAAVLLDRAGVWSASHSIPRYTLVDYRLQYPDGLGETKWRLSYPRAFAELVIRNARANQIPPALQWAIMREESAFSPHIESFANAVGLTQMLVKTARRFSNGAPVTREALLDPAKNLEYGARFLAFLWTRFGKAAPLTIAGYNAGEGAVDHWLGERGNLFMDEFIEQIPYDETRNYTKRVLASYLTYTWLYDDQNPVPPVPLLARPR
jgi:soluble lytic murein transglycosylase